MVTGTGALGWPRPPGASAMPSGAVPSVPGVASFKRALFGYRRGEVDRAIAEGEGKLEQARERIELQGAEIEARGIQLAGRERRIDELERVATALSERVVERSRELQRLQAELARVREESDVHVESLTALMGELEDVRRQARGQATRIRLKALREAAELSERVAELTRRPGEVRERLVEALTEAVARIGAEDEVAEVALSNGNGNGRAERDPADLFNGLIEVEIGPLRDFSQLVGFEDAAKSIAATSEISVKRFSEGRATLAVSLDEPVALLRELEERCDLEFRVRDLRADRVILDVDDE
jgi:FtsZ-binding cell division protein ZapB